MTFLVPNGCDALDETAICDPTDLTRYWLGRTKASGDGWRVTIDRDSAMDHSAWRELKDMGGRRFTHAGRLERVDGSTFTGDEAFEALARVRLGMNIGLGRRITCALPVGWRNGQPVWTDWRRAPVDEYTKQSHWLDGTICARQIGKIVSLTLAFTADAVNREALGQATSYYVAANVDVDVQFAAAIPISALQLLSYLRFVTDRGTCSRKKFKDLRMKGQVRLLIDDLSVNTTIPQHFEHLTKMRDRLAQTGSHWDALDAVIEMRNVATHPTRGQPGNFSIYEWAEAGMLARYWLCLALLNTVGYDDQIAVVLEAPPLYWPSAVRPLDQSITTISINVRPLEVAPICVRGTGSQ